MCYSMVGVEFFSVLKIIDLQPLLKKVLHGKVHNPNELGYFQGKFLDTLGVQRNDALSFHIHGRFHHEFNEWVLP